MVGFLKSLGSVAEPCPAGTQSRPVGRHAFAISIKGRAGWRISGTSTSHFWTCGTPSSTLFAQHQSPQVCRAPASRRGDLPRSDHWAPLGATAAPAQAFGTLRARDALSRAASDAAQLSDARAHGRQQSRGERRIVRVSPQRDPRIPRPLAGGLGTRVRFATRSCAALTPLAPLVEREGSHPFPIRQIKRPARGHFIWRRERDSNPRYTFLRVCSLSRGVPSTTRPSLR